MLTIEYKEYTGSLTDTDIINVFCNKSRKILGVLAKEQWVTKHPDYMNYLLGRFHDIDSETTFAEIIYRIKNKIEIVPKCKNCGKRISYNGVKGYREFCSHKCYNEYKTNLSRIFGNT